MYDIIGDVHGCLIELYELLSLLGYKNHDILYKHPNRKLIFVGDIVDRGDYSVETYYFIKNMVENNLASLVLGNHDDKLMRWAKGNKVKLTNGLDNTVNSFQKSNITKESIVNFFSNIPYFLNKNVIIVHAAWNNNLITYDKYDNKCRFTCLHGPNNGLLSDGKPNRIDWVKNRKLTNESPYIVCGHQVFNNVRLTNKVYQIDTGCVFGGKLTCLRWPEKEIIQVDAKKVYSIK